MISLFILLFVAHLLGDFFLQRTSWVRDKEQHKWKSPQLYIHTLIHFTLLVAITGLVNLVDEDQAGGIGYFLLPAGVIALSHLVIDGLKLSLQTERTKRTWFFVDQALHLTILLGVAVAFAGFDYFPDKQDLRAVIAVVTGAIFLTRPTSFFIRTIISRWPPDLSDKSETGITRTVRIADQRSLENAGELIGMLERLIILIFILLGKWEGVGFLLAAKSVFRFGDLKEARDRKLTEYVLIGTLLSFGIAIVTGIATDWLMRAA